MAFAGAYYLAGRLGLAITFVHASASPVWPPTGIAIAGLLVFGARAWPAVFVGATLFNLHTTGHWQSSILIGIGNTLEGLAGAYILRRILSGPRLFGTPNQVLAFATVAAAAPIVSASIGTASLWVTGLLVAPDLPSVWFTWWLGDVTGAFVVAPPLILLLAPRIATPGRLFDAPIGITEAVRRAPRWPTKDHTTPILLWAAAILIAALAFAAPGIQRGLRTALFLVFAPLFLIAIQRSPPLLSAWATLAVGALAVLGTLAERGPFTALTNNEAFLFLDGFLTSLVVASLLFGTAWTGRATETHSTEQVERHRTAGHSSRPLENLPMIVALVALLPLFGATVVGGQLAQDLVDDVAAERRGDHAEAVAGAITAMVDAHVAELHALRAFVRTTDTLDHAAFTGYITESAWL